MLVEALGILAALDCSSPEAVKRLCVSVTALSGGLSYVLRRFPGLSFVKRASSNSYQGDKLELKRGLDSPRL